jgi:hypothetical protein
LHEVYSDCERLVCQKLNNSICRSRGLTR